MLIQIFDYNNSVCFFFVFVFVLDKRKNRMAAQVANLPSLLIGRVLTKSNASTALVRVLQMKLDDKFDMFFNQRKLYLIEKSNLNKSRLRNEL